MTEAASDQKTWNENVSNQTGGTDGNNIQDNIPKTLDELLVLRRDMSKVATCGRVAMKGFFFLVDKIFGAVVGKRGWRTDKCYFLVRQKLTISDEAFCLLVLENQWDILKNTTNGNAETKYTAIGKNIKP